MNAYGADQTERVIEIERLNKSFGSVRAVRDLSFQVRKGELFAFLGVNGAGKSTTISILCGQLRRDSGDVRVCGLPIEGDARAVSEKIGVVFQNSVLDRALTVRDNLECRAALYGLTGAEFRARFDELAERLDFAEFADRAVGTLSGGQRRRADIARALLHRPRILVLDEPTTGLDPQTRNLLWDVVRDLRRSEDLTVFLTTHYMEEAADADYVVILDHGEIVAKGTPLDLKNRYSGDFVTFYGLTEEEKRTLGRPCETLRDGVRVAVSDTAEATAWILRSPELFRDYEITKGNMDDVFLSVTGKKLNGAPQGTAERGNAV